MRTWAVRSCAHPVSDRRRHLVARRELVREAPTGRVEKRGAFAAHRLGDERPVVLGARQRQGRGMELAELEVSDCRARFVREHRSRPDRAPRVRGPLP